MIIPDRLFIGAPCTRDQTLPDTELVEIGSDFCDLPTAKEILDFTADRARTMVAWHVITHRRTDPRYKAMQNPVPEHAAVGHFERSRWTDEAWEQTDRLARATDVQAVLLQTPASFKPTTEHATRLENFVAHATRPGLAIAWEWAPGSWPAAKALELCARIGAIPAIDPAETPLPDDDDYEFVYVRFRAGPSGRRALKDDDLKKTALAVRDRIGWVVFANQSGAQDAARFKNML